MDPVVEHVAAPVVDVHVHATPPAFVTALTEGATRAAHLVAHHDALIDRDRRLREMDSAGIDLAVLSIPPPGPGILDGPGAAVLARRVDDGLLADAGRDVDRFAVLLTLPTCDPAGALAHLDELGDEALVAGVYAFAHHQRHRLDDPALEPVWAAAARRGLPLVLHPAFEEPPGALRDWQLPTALDAVFSTSLVAARLMLSGTLDRVPDLQLVLPHLGGTLPYLLQRLVDQSGTGDALHDIGHYLRHRVVVDTCSFHPPALRCAVDTVGPDRVVLGSDFPFRGAFTRAVQDVAGSDLRDQQRLDVLGRNATRFLRLRRPVSSSAGR